MKVLLVSSRTLPTEPPLYPVGLAHLAGSLDGHEVRCFDFNTCDRPHEAAAEAVRAFSPDVIGLSIRNMFFARPGQIWSPFRVHQEIVQTLRRAAPSCMFVVGGSGFSLYAEKVLERCPEIDFGVFGEGEITFKSLVERPGAFRTEPGIYYRDNGVVRYAGDRLWLDFGALPGPKWDFTDIAPYLRHRNAIGVQTKRGCLLRCLHCSDLYLVGPSARLRAPEKVIDDLEFLRSRHGVREFMFADQVFNIPSAHAEAICLEMRRRKLGMRWSAWFNEQPVNTRAMKLYKEAGCAMAFFSPDSAHDPTLRALHKNISHRDIRKAIRVCRETKMRMTMDFMINQPGDTVWGILKTVMTLIVAKAQLRGLLATHGRSITYLRIYPHTELRELAVRQRVVSPRDDLMEVSYYNYGFVCYFGRFVMFLETLAWRVLGWLRHDKRALSEVPCDRH